MEREEAIHRGFLLLPPVGKILKKSWQQKYCLLFKSSKFGIERLEVYDAADSKEYKIITLENCIKVHSKSTTTFCITTKTASYEFGALTEHSMNEWLTAIQSVAFPEEVSKITSIEEDNDLYCSSGEGVFNVKLHTSPVSQRCGLESKNYTLVLTSTAIQLRTIIDSRLLFTWPYCYIRRYGYKSGKFTFEAGRKCESGEGTFFLEHPNQQEIFRCLATKMKSMKKLLSGESTPTLLDCGDQLHAALTMEARSRTPLPPSSTVQSLQESLSKSQISVDNLDFGMKTMWMSKTLSQSSVLDMDFSKIKSLPKPVPVKPPRKYVPLKTEDDPAYEPVEHKLDHVEPKSDYVPFDNEVPPRESETIKPPVREAESYRPPPAPTIISQSVTNLDDDSYYDKLNFFGSTSKLNKSSGYKQVFPIPIPPVQETPTYNHYDEVQCVDIVKTTTEDSYLGYMKIPPKDQQSKKETEEKKKKEVQVAHQLKNEEPYAVIILMTKPYNQVFLKLMQLILNTKTHHRLTKAGKIRCIYLENL